MKAASRIIGVLLIVAGSGFLAIFAYGVFSRVLPGAALWFFALLTIALLVAGRSYLRFDPGADEMAVSPSKAAEMLVTNRASLKVLAQTGLALSVIQMVLACVGSAWPGKWAEQALVLGVVALWYAGRKMSSPLVENNRDWDRVPQPIRSALPRIFSVAWLSLALLLSISQWSHILSPWPTLESLAENIGSRLVTRVLSAICLAGLYAVEALYFAYGELRPVKGETLLAD